MRTIETINLIVCTDCIMIMAHGIDEHDDRQREHALRMLAHTRDWKGHFVPGTADVSDFSSMECDTCGTTLAGARSEAALLTEVETEGSE